MDFELHPVYDTNDYLHHEAYKPPHEVIDLTMDDDDEVNEEDEEQEEEKEPDHNGYKADMGEIQDDRSDTSAQEDDHIPWFRTNPAETQHVLQHPDQPLGISPVTYVDPPIHPRLNLDAHIKQASDDLDAGKHYGRTYLRGFQYTALWEIEQLEKEIRPAMERILQLERSVRKYEYLRHRMDTVEERPEWFKQRMEVLDRRMSEYKALCL
jgi:hypothetical protein